MAGRYEIGEDAGLEAMAKSVEIELAKTAGKKTVRFRVWGPSTAGKDWDELDELAAKGSRGAPFVDVEGVEGMSFKDVVEHGDGDGAVVLGEWIECACDGIMACSVSEGERSRRASSTAREAQTNCLHSTPTNNANNE